ncbi:hypothetical protein GTW56_08800 [Bacillus sp. EB93]|nr:hypothetical protein [Peribacillus frigoritolerans]
MSCCLGIFSEGYNILYCWGFILYIVIETAVRRGINHSIIGQFLEKKYGMKEDKKSFLDDDLDNENKEDY